MSSATCESEDKLVSCFMKAEQGLTYLTRTQSKLAVLRISHQESLSLGLLVAWAATLGPLLLPRRCEAGRCRRRAGRDVGCISGSGGSWVRAS